MNDKKNNIGFQLSGFAIRTAMVRRVDKGVWPLIVSLGTLSLPEKLNYRTPFLIGSSTSLSDLTALGFKSDGCNVPCT